MPGLLRGLCSLAVLAGLAGAASAQSLGETAQREQKKKKQALASPVPTYTEADLKASGRGKSNGTFSELRATGSFAAPSPAPGASPSPSPSPSAEPDRAPLELEWRARFAEARARVAEADALAYEDRIEVVFVAGMPVQQRVRVKVETPELRAAKEALADLEDELRRSGGLPGRARE